ncbi:MFS transporter [Ktedonobacter racemifer]|uniref:Major facilitator superfamily MFS_1 n=1 Tax=Ktedonobacter racemifer DSM 44963 TaxID=485913 RepID=D6U1Q1_KTERA|nr:MFS transporter [Ktedonobacter racemifer]EFH82695.1 major facilitator superfamily MFS_1 [Ktedonobacter racemifer DSM 44963]
MSTDMPPENETVSPSVAQPPTLLKQDGEVLAQAGSREPNAAQPVGGGMFHPFRVHNFTLLFGGQTISVLGDALYAVALPWLVLTTGGSAQELGLVLTAYGIPRAASMLVGGWLSDRLHPRRVMLMADAVRLLLMALLAALALGGHPTVFQFCAIAVPLGAFGGAFTPASMSILPDTLSNENLQAGNGLMMSSMQGANLIGSAFAGVVMAAFTAGAALAIDAATFLVSALSLALMRTPSRATSSTKEAGASRENPSASTQEQGTRISFWQYLRTSRLIQVTLLLFIVISLCSGGLVEVALPALIHSPMHGSASSYGVILAAWGAGALVGAIFAGMLGKRKHKGLIVFLGGLIVAAMIALLPIGGIPGAIVCMLIGGIANSGLTILLFTAVQLNIPSHLMGRVMGLLMFCSFGMYPFSVALAGVLSNQFGPAILFPFGGLFLALAMLFGMTQTALREI